MFFRLDLKIISFIFLHPANDIVSIVSRLQGNDTEAMSEFSKAFAQILTIPYGIIMSAADSTAQ